MLDDCAACVALILYRFCFCWNDYLKRSRFKVCGINFILCSFKNVKVTADLLRIKTLAFSLKIYEPITKTFLFVDMFKAIS